LKVRHEFDLLEAGGREQVGDCLRLAVADFEGEVAAGDETMEGLRDEAAVDVEAVGAGEKGESWFVVADFDGERVAVSGGDVGRVGDYDFELFAGYRGEEIAFEKAEIDSVTFRIFLSDCEGGGGPVDGGDCCVRQMVFESDCNRAGPGSDVHDAGLWEWRRQCNGVFNQMLCLRAGDENVWRNEKRKAVELRFADDVLDGFATIATFDESHEIGGLVVGEFFLPMGEKPSSVFAE